MNPHDATGLCLAVAPLIAMAVSIGSRLRDRSQPLERVRRAARKERNARPPLLGWAEEHARAGSGVWSISPPCGYDSWDLYAPGTGLDSRGFIDTEPTATFPAKHGPGLDPMTDGGEPFTLDEVREWAVPWIEEVSGGKVVDLVDGWGAPYGPNREHYEYAVFAKVEGGQL